MGEKATKDWYCSSCGNMTSREKNFCVHCGAQLSEQIVGIAHPDPQPVQKQPVVIIQQQQPQPIQQPQIQPQVTVIREAAPSNGAADTALVFAILSIFCLPFLGGFLAMLFGCCGAFTPYKRGTAIVSFVIGLVTSGLWIIPLVMFIIPMIASGVWFWM